MILLSLFYIWGATLLALVAALVIAAVRGELRAIRRERDHVARHARRAAKAYGVSLVPRDEVADRRARRGGGRAA